MIEVKADKMIVNVESTINAIGSDALELLRKSPGVSLTKTIIYRSQAKPVYRFISMEGLRHLADRILPTT
jgi:hypothetical protein